MALSGLPLLSSVLRRSQIIFGAESLNWYNHILMDKLQGRIVWAPIFDYCCISRCIGGRVILGRERSTIRNICHFLLYCPFGLFLLLKPRSLKFIFLSSHDAHATTRNSSVFFSRICGNLPSGRSLVSYYSNRWNWSDWNLYVPRRTRSRIFDLRQDLRHGLGRTLVTTLLNTGTLRKIEKVEQMMCKSVGMRFCPG